MLLVPVSLVLLVLLDIFQVPLDNNATHALVSLQAVTLSQHQLVMHGQSQHLLGLHAQLNHQMLHHAGSPLPVPTNPLHAPQDIIYPLQELVLLVQPSPQAALLVLLQDASSACLDISCLVPQTAQTAQETAQHAQMLQTAVLA